MRMKRRKEEKRKKEGPKKRNSKRHFIPLWTPWGGVLSATGREWWRLAKVAILTFAHD
jgi:hypothetical protein